MGIVSLLLSLIARDFVVVLSMGGKHPCCLPCKVQEEKERYSKGQKEQFVENVREVEHAQQEGGGECKEQGECKEEKVFNHPAPYALVPCSSEMEGMCKFPGKPANHLQDIVEWIKGNEEGEDFKGAEGSKYLFRKD